MISSIVVNEMNHTNLVAVRVRVSCFSRAVSRVRCVMAGCSEVLMLLEKHKHTVGSELNCSNILPVLVKKGVFSSKEDELLANEFSERNGNYTCFF